MNPSNVGPWIGNWVWGLPLIVLTTVIHVVGLAPISERVVHRTMRAIEGRAFMPGSP